MVTLAEVARHAGVSLSTVSYVLSGKRSISESTRARVQHSIRALGYYPHAGARALASNRSSIIALVMPLRGDMYVPVLMEIVTAVATTAREHDHDVLLLTNDEGPTGLLRVARSGLADALLLMDVELHDERVPVLLELDSPSVLIGFPEAPSGLTCVDLDFQAAARVSVRELAAAGHRTIALLGPPERVYERETGFAQRTVAGFVAEAELCDVEPVRVPLETGYGAAAAGAAKLVAERPDITGFVVQNEVVASMLPDVLRDAGRRLPREDAVVAICPDRVAEQTTPRLTSVSIPAEEMGRNAVELVMAKLRGETVAEETLLPPQLTVRETTMSTSTP